LSFCGIHNTSINIKYAYSSTANRILNGIESTPVAPIQYDVYATY
jgi:hypothetical protein